MHLIISLHFKLCYRGHIPRYIQHSRSINEFQNRMNIPSHTLQCTVCGCIVECNFPIYLFSSYQALKAIDTHARTVIDIRCPMHIQTHEQMGAHVPSLHNDSNSMSQKNCQNLIKDLCIQNLPSLVGNSNDIVGR